MAFARKQELKPQATEVNGLIDSTVKLIRSTLPANIAIDVRATSPLGNVFIDPNRLETALLNLALNARDAMPNGGTLTIETFVRELDEDYVNEHIDVQQGDYVLIAVTDTGTGMPRDVLDRAFVPFFTTKEVGKGTGLGLSMVYGFVKQSGGHAQIYSEVGLGTVVKIYLPVLGGSNSADTRPEAVAVQANNGSGHILLVEDDPIVRQSISNKLTRLGYRVATAETAHDAIVALVAMPHFDLVFSDVVMPGAMNGADLIREVQQRWPGIKVLLTSGYTETTALGKIKLPENVKLLSKPYSNAELSQAIEDAINGNRPSG
jgi:CheY-like chemotaxis protein